MLGSFFAFLVAIFIAEICAGVFIYFQKETLESLIEKSVEETVLQKYMYNSSSASVHTFDKVQEEMGCCGSKGPKDWARSVFNNPESRDREIGVIVSNQKYNIPRSCCRYRLSIIVR
ncbi:CD151 antigen [Eurytemora carolleeae]|uniref:CD151 antigen n=1 Tax=Eurytemora carolleeae TaxID=1294199 RepID=UPI000C76F697|nr:CD151 antigen [Eurytemora carolleeae]|eukprot:XP_023337357.1 CD151 antigen-like [Eurytemora affinis]